MFPAPVTLANGCSSSVQSLCQLPPFHWALNPVGNFWAPSSRISAWGVRNSECHLISVQLPKLSLQNSLGGEKGNAGIPWVENETDEEMANIFHYQIPLWACSSSGEIFYLSQNKPTTWDCTSQKNEARQEFSLLLCKYLDNILNLSLGRKYIKYLLSGLWWAE